MHEALRRFKADFFQALAHPTRIAIVEQLRDGELSAGALIERLGIEQANASQHLAVLRAKNILISRKTGNQVFYSVRDPLIIEVLDLMRRYFHAHLSEVMTTLKTMDTDNAKTDTAKAAKAHR
ncbi:MAG TPA: metalloregulator ArsR/SmtB family transcription factor [Bryobacteraceae bacterium]|jgi:ArsR family transcriptional regulator